MALDGSSGGHTAGRPGGTVEGGACWAAGDAFDGVAVVAPPRLRTLTTAATAMAAFGRVWPDPERYVGHLRPLAGKLLAG